MTTSNASPATSAFVGLSQTDWSVIDAARGEGPASAEEAIEELARRYWPSIFAFIRRHGRDEHEAADLTQGFVCDVVLGRHLIRGADRSRGRFRTLLMHSVKNYLREQHRRDHRQRRAPPAGMKVLDLDHADLSTAATPAATTPQAAFDAQWAATLIRRALDRLRRECLADGLDAHWTIFEGRVARPLLCGDEPTDYERLVAELNLPDASQAANMMSTVKRRFVRVLRQEVSLTVREPWQIQEELRALVRDLEHVAP